MGHRRRGVGRPYDCADGCYWTRMGSQGTSSPRVWVRDGRSKGEGAVRSPQATPSSHAGRGRARRRMSGMRALPFRCIIRLMNRSIEARRVGLGVRPYRVCLLVPDSFSIDHAVSLIGVMTSAWGGMVWSLIPIDGDSISEPFRTLMRKYDPDYVARVPELPDSDKIWSAVRREVCPLSGIGDHLLTVWPPGNLDYPLTGIEKCLTDVEVGVPGYSEGLWIKELRVKADPLASALMYSWTGCLADDTRQRLREAGIVTDENKKTDPDAYFLLSVLNGDWHKPAQGWLDPMQMSLRWLGGHHSKTAFQYPPVIVCGDTFKDFALFWTLRALRGNPWRPLVAWVPRLQADSQRPSILDDSGSFMSSALNGFYRGRGGRSQVIATSNSLTGDYSEALTALLAKPLFRSSRDTPPEVSLVKPEDVGTLVPYDVTYWESNNSPGVNSSIIQFLDGEGAALLNTPTPRNVARSLLGNEMRWAVDVDVEALRVPRRPRLAPALMVVPSQLVGVRPSKEGVSYDAISGLIPAGATIESILIRPRPLLPSNEEIIQSCFSEVGLAVALSDKGQYEREAIRLFGDLTTLGHHLRNPGTASFLLRFVDESPNEAGVDDQGVFMKARGARFFRLKDLALVVREPPALKKMLDFYLKRRLLHRGLLIKCRVCRAADWYPMSSVTAEVTCSRCHRAQIYVAETEIFFQLDEMVRLALKNNSHISLLALAHLQRGSEKSFLFITASDLSETDESSDGGSQEADFLAVADGALVVGESKKGGTLTVRDKAQMKRYAKLCQRVRADKFVVATDATDWGESAHKFFDELEVTLAAGRTEMSRLTSRDLGWDPGGDVTTLGLVMSPEK